MSNIKKTSHSNLKLRLSNYEYWDLSLADYSGCFSCGSLDLPQIVDIEFGQDFVCSNIEWTGATSNVATCDYGLTMIVNRTTLNLTGETFTGGTQFCMNIVSGDTFCYNYEHSGTTTDLCGGFYQGFYKLFDYDYQVLPNRFDNGWTVEIDLFPKTGCTSCIDKPLLNEFYENNSGMFYYMGLRATNKFCNIFSGETGEATCENVPLSPEISLVEGHFTNGENGFTFYTQQRVCENDFPMQTGEMESCCDAIINNNLGFRITEDGKIGFRYITTTGFCGDTSDHTEQITTIEHYSLPNVISFNTWQKITLKFEPYIKNQCEQNRLGEMSIYVDGYRKVVIKNVPEIIPYELKTDRSKQVGVPFTISVGGGTQGLIESLTYGGIDSNDETLPFTACTYTSCYMVEGETFTGMTVDGIEYEAPELTFEDRELIKMFIELTINERYGKVEMVEEMYCGKLRIHFKINLTTQFPNWFSLSTNERRNFFENECVVIPPNPEPCDLLETNFAGSFIGMIRNFNLYDGALSVQEIRCL